MRAVDLSDYDSLPDGTLFQVSIFGELKKKVGSGYQAIGRPNGKDYVVVDIHDKPSTKKSVFGKGNNDIYVLDESDIASYLELLRTEEGE